MVFNSVAFVLFFFLAAAVYFALPHRVRWLWLILSSAAFYLSFIPAYLGVLLSVALLNYAAGLAIERSAGARRKRVFVLGLAANILVLVFFKYSSLFDATLSALARFLDLRCPEGLLRVVLPLGLSFFVFTALAYLIEIHRGKIRAERHPGVLAAYFLFFPKLAQGPIERPGDLLHQFREPHALDAERISSGLRLMLFGYFKKLVVADRLGLYVDAVYGNADHHGGASLLLATLFYSFQIYADFSGYTDIALGSARVLGFRLSPNFRRPYLAVSISDFWNRWHITLSTWLRDYLFLPLAYFFSNRIRGPRVLFLKADKWVYFFSVFITFLICGAWHGEGLNYVVWGGLYGLYLTVSTWTRKAERRFVRSIGLARRPRFHQALRVLSTFALVTFAWIFFRGGETERILQIIGKIAASPGRLFLDSPSTMIYSVLGVAAVIVLDVREEFFEGRFSPFAHRSAFVRCFAHAALAVTVLLFGVLDGGQFIYFQF
ncbi:MAG: MBOAT family O-acyltransferase [Candidatus Eisenbacteria bacterium]